MKKIILSISILMGLSFNAQAQDSVPYKNALPSNIKIISYGLEVERDSIFFNGHTCEVVFTIDGVEQIAEIDNFSFSHATSENASGYIGKKNIGHYILIVEDTYWVKKSNFGYRFKDFDTTSNYTIDEDSDPKIRIVKISFADQNGNILGSYTEPRR